MDPIITPLLITAVAAGAGVATGVVTATAAVISVAATAASALASAYTSRKASSPVAATATAVTAAVAELPTAATFSISPANASREIVTQQGLPPRRMVFGECRIGGPLFFKDVLAPHLYMGLLHSDGRCDPPLRVFMGEYPVDLDVNGDAIAGNRYFGRFKYEYGSGDAAQTFSPLLNAGFPGTVNGFFRQQGVARSVFRFDWGADSEQHSLLWSDIAPAVLGRWLRVYDPRDGAQTQDNPATWVYSDNPALCVAHVLRHWWRAPVPYASIDWTTVTEAANDCDVMFGAFKLFRLAGVVQSDVELPSQLQEMLSSFGGSITYYDGKYQIHADKSRAPVVTFTDVDLLGVERADFDADASRIFNRITAIYQSSDLIGRTTTTPALDMTAAQAGEGVQAATLALPFTPDNHSAQILAYRHMLYSRDGRTAVFRFTDVAIELRPPQVFTLQSETYPWLNGDYQCTQIDLAGFGVIVAARRYVPDAYADPSTYVI